MWKQVDTNMEVHGRQSYRLLTSPLDMQQVVILLDGQPVGNEVVLHRWVDLHDVAPLAAHVQVVDVFVVGHAVLLAAPQLDDVCTILESSPELGGVHGELQRWFEDADVDFWIVLDQPEKKRNSEHTSFIHKLDDMCSTHS